MNFVFLRFTVINTETQGVYCDGDPLGLLQQLLFVDFSNSVRVVMIKRNHKSFHLYLLLLCGDVQLNPGPTIDFPCSVCGINVLDNDKAVCCDSCDKWVHVSCDPSLSNSLYDEMIQMSLKNAWFCTACMNNVYSSECSTKHHGLSCLCLNARSILPKRHDLFALICSISVDILAITETFLDSSISDTEVCPKGFM